MGLTRAEDDTLAVKAETALLAAATVDAIAEGGDDSGGRRGGEAGRD